VDFVNEPIRHATTIINGLSEAEREIARKRALIDALGRMIEATMRLEHTREKIALCDQTIAAKHEAIEALQAVLVLQQAVGRAGGDTSDHVPPAATKLSVAGSDIAFDQHFRIEDLVEA
jgi:hypothetical protein